MRPSTSSKSKEIPSASSTGSKKPSTPSSAQSKQSATSQTRQSLAPPPKQTKQLPLTEEEKKLRREIIEPIQQFECLRNVLLQWVFLNSYFKEEKKSLKERMEVEFYDRTQQVLTLQDEALKMKANISKEEAIKELEEILAIEFPVCQNISQGIVDFEENLEILKDYMENVLKKIEVGENIVIYADEFNEELIAIKDKLVEIQTKYNEEWENSNTVEKKMKEFIELSLLEHQELMALIELMASKQSSIEKRNFDDYTRLQEKRIRDLEALVYSDL